MKKRKAKATEKINILGVSNSKSKIQTIIIKKKPCNATPKQMVITLKLKNDKNSLRHQRTQIFIYHSKDMH